ncbi:hypothetical protein P4O66_009145 [Electrophorus voltai]|uniref:Uncharacterized protein n=1 Tax=Electrophorus voltai TaxID=2609070 RepID=A0AAD9DUN9_9TELE|nr:hypothetical protein P4O66_009145 [Electrophorus voltai]
MILVILADLPDEVWQKVGTDLQIYKIVYNDNGNAKEFQAFAKMEAFQHVTSSPLYVQSNGKAEKGVHIVKQLLKDDNADP